MNSKLTTSLAAAAITLIALPVFADTGLNAGAGLNVKAGFQNIRAAIGLHAATSAKENSDNSKNNENKIGDKSNATSTAAQLTNSKTRATNEIQRRIDALTDANTRVQAMVNVSVSVKTLISNAVQTQISALTTLKAKINADIDLAAVKTDIKTINSTYRIFLLVLPQGRILVGSDAVQNVAGTMTSIGAKLNTRITAAHTAGKDTTALSASLTDMTAKIADARVQATAATNLVANLTPDNGDTVKAQANAQALATARADLKVASSDLKAARTDIASIVSGLKAITL